MSTHTTLILGDTTYPWIDIVDRGARAATGLAEFGVNKNDSIALLLRNDPPFFEVTTAAQRLGAYSVPINWHFTADEVLHVLRDSNAKALVVHADGRMSFRGQDIGAPSDYLALLDEESRERVRIVPDAELPAIELVAIGRALRRAGAGSVVIVTERGLE